jgi:hypothetical protein
MPLAPPLRKVALLRLAGVDPQQPFDRCNQIGTEIPLRIR